MTTETKWILGAAVAVVAAGAAWHFGVFSPKGQTAGADKTKKATPAEIARRAKMIKARVEGKA